MKPYIFALVAALLMIGQLFSPVAAASNSAAACGDTYVVQRGDYLSKIARTCGVTTQSLIAANPEIKDINKIYPGQVIRIKAGSNIPTPTPTPGTSQQYTVQRGDTLFKIGQKFGVTVQSLLNANPSITNASLIYAGQVINIPSGSGSIPSTGRRVTLSATSAKVGAQVEVKIFGFPANMDVDFRLGKLDTAYSAVYDARTDAKGEATVKVTIPNAAKVNEKWVVKVMTTGMANGVEITSPTVTIVQ